MWAACTLKAHCRSCPGANQRSKQKLSWAMLLHSGTTGPLTVLSSKISCVSGKWSIGATNGRNSFGRRRCHDEAVLMLLASSRRCGDHEEQGHDPEIPARNASKAKATRKKKRVAFEWCLWFAPVHLHASDGTFSSSRPTLLTTVPSSMTSSSESSSLGLRSI